MNRYRMQPSPAWWSPRLRPRLIRMLRPLRAWRCRSEQQLLQIDVQGAEIVRQALADGAGVMITPNHPTHADAFSIYAAADAAETAFYIMTAWQVFDAKTRLGQWILRTHGCFSVDREATDLRAFRQAVQLLQDEPYPLVIFPEGEVYHCNERVTTFREGAAVIALSAAKRAKRPIVCVPCALKYEYIQDPTPELERLMDLLEERIAWRPRRNQPLAERIYRFAEAALALKEMEYRRSAGSGTLPERLHELSQFILQQLEQRYEISTSDAILPERVKQVRGRIMERLAAVQEVRDAESQRQQLYDDLDDVFLVAQLFSYPGDYVAERPSIERMAETLDKFEEDVLGRYTATIRGTRRARVRFGQPVAVEAGRRSKDAARQLTETLEQRVQKLLDAGTGPLSAAADLVAAKPEV